ncbi:MAG: ABC transporter substrate binding protein [Syntrophales bacterium]|nr:ABC transporter substrate binding protein [Syntrophales bacterium]
MGKARKVKTCIGYMKIMLIVLIVMLVQIIPEGKTLGESSRESRDSKKGWKILHIMSYHSPWKWTDDQFNGFKDALRGLSIEYRIFQMDTKQKSTEEWKQKVGKEARDLIHNWKPDLVYTNDDNAQKYVTKYYVNSDIPFVFSGVNADPEEYEFVGSSNITGILEQEHFVETVRLLKEIVPDVGKIAVIIDEDPTWDGVTKRMKQKSDQLPGVQFVSWDVIDSFEEFKHRIKQLQTEADAIALIGVFTYKDKYGNNVPYAETLKWTAENSNLPDFSFWEDRIPYGTLCTVTVSGYEQGLAAGKIARGILADGKRPSSYPIKPTVKGEPVISLARANRLGIKIKAGTLLTVKVIERFEWEK